MGPRELYDVTGDSEAAMRLMVEGKNGSEQSPQNEYNCLLLTALATSTTPSSNSGKKNKSNKDDDISLLDESLEDARTVVRNSHSHRNKSAIAEDWALAYNRGLVLLSTGKVEESIHEAWSYLKPIIHPDNISLSTVPFEVNRISTIDSHDHIRRINQFTLLFL